MKKAITIILVLVLTFPLLSIPYYDKGSQELTLSAGSLFPIADMDSYIPNVSFDWQIFIHPYVSLGFNTGIQATDIQNANIGIPLLFKFQYIPAQDDICDVLLSLGAGILLDLNSTSNLRIFLDIPLEMAIRLYINDNWGFGVSAGITALTNISLSPVSISGISTFLPLRATATYRF